LRRVGLLYNHNIRANVDFLHVTQGPATVVGVAVNATEVHDAADIDHVLTEFAQEPDVGFIVAPNPLNARNTQTIIEIAARLHLPAIYPFREDAEKGGQISYTFDTLEQQRGVAIYVDRILKGEKPADLPVQALTKYQLIINLRTAKSLGVSISPALLATTDEVIE
jgi:putative ABC transport system substrate-binding protein